MMFSSLFGSCTKLAAKCCGTEEGTANNFYVPRINLCGSERTQTSSFFKELAANNAKPRPDPELGELPAIQIHPTSTKVFTASQEPLLLNSSNKNAATPNSGIVATTGFYNAVNQAPEPINSMSCYFGVLQTTVVEMPPQARFDHTFMRSMPGTICYLVPLDAFDEFAPGETISVLMQEVENVKKFTQSRREGDNNSMIVLFTGIADFEAKIARGVQLPAFLRGHPKNATIAEIRKFAATTLAKAMEKNMALRFVFAYCAPDFEKSELALTTTVRTIYLTCELTHAGFMF